MTEPTTTQLPGDRHPNDPTYTIDDITEIGWDLAATTLERDGYRTELAAANRAFDTIAEAAGLPAGTAAADIATRVRQSRQERDHLAAEYRRAVDELDRSLRETVTIRRQRDQLVDDLDITRAARDRYQRATTTLRAELNAQIALRHSAYAGREEVCHRIDTITVMTDGMLDEETITVGELRHWLRVDPAQLTQATGRRADSGHMQAVVEAARAFRRTPDRGEVAIALLDAVDAYETAADAPTPAAPDLSQVIAERIASADLVGPADTVLARATIAVDVYLEQLLASFGAAKDSYDDINREDLAKVVLAAADADMTDPNTLIDRTRTQLASAETDDDRADAIAELLEAWQTAWPDSAVTDPNWPLAQALVQLLGSPDVDADPDTSLIDGLIDAERKHADERVAEARAVESQKADNRVGELQFQLEKTREQLATALTEAEQARTDLNAALLRDTRNAKLVDRMQLVVDAAKAWRTVLDQPSTTRLIDVIDTYNVVTYNRDGGR